MAKVLWDSLQDLQKVFTRSDFLTAARQHAKGKLSIQDKVTLLFDSGTFSGDKEIVAALAALPNIRAAKTHKILAAIFDHWGRCLKLV